MATKFGLAGGIPERRVRPIWDAVDSRQFKTALKLSVALLAKYPNSPYALALKALILERMGKPDEALSICLNAKDQLYSNNVIHIDDLTLITLQIVSQRLDRLDLATSCYEHACSKYPNNLEILMGLFNCYIREYSFVKQQQTAIKMYKIVAEERFLLWAVCSIQLQVFCNGGGDKLLSLAEALLKKHIASHSLHEPEALLVYISILEEQGKFDAALEVLSGDLGSHIGIEVDKLRIQGRLLARACDYAAAAESFQRVLEVFPDDWESFHHYLGCLLEEDIDWSQTWDSDEINSKNLFDYRTCKSTSLSDQVFDSRISSALSFVQKLQTDAENDTIRGPYLARIEIECRCRLKGQPDDDKLLDALLTYFRRFSYLSCCTSDVERFLHILTENEKADLLEKIARISDPPASSSAKILGQAMTFFKIQEFFGVTFTRSVRELEDTAVQMVEMFCKNLGLSKDLDLQENMHGEELLCMACNVLVQLSWRTKQLGYFLEAILVLEFGLTIRRHVWQYKILLLHMYSQLEALPLAYEWYGTLEVKNILLETLSHHILPEMLKSPLMAETTDLLEEYLKFMDDHLREAADLTFLAYRHRNYSKVVEFVCFKERLQHSNQYLMSRLDSSILRLKQEASSLLAIESTFENSNYGIQLLDMSNEEKLKTLTFNGDLQSRPWWSPTPDTNYLSEPFEGGSACLRERMCKSQTDQKTGVVMKIIERKALLLRLVYLSYQIASVSFKENFGSNGSVTVTNHSSELKIMLERYARNAGLSCDDAIQAVVGISKGQKLKDFEMDMVYWINFAVFVNALSLSSHCPGLLSVDACSSFWNTVDSLVENSISEQLTCTRPVLTGPGGNLKLLVQLVTESLSWHILVIQACMRSLLPSGKKKKKTSADDQPNSSQLQVVRSSIQCLIRAIQGVQKWLGDQISRTENECLDVLVSHVRRRVGEDGPGRALEIIDQASSSYSDMGDQISAALQSWSSPTVARKIVGAQRTQLLQFHGICESKLKLLECLKQII